MKAVIWTRSGPPEVLTVQEIAKPVPADHEVLIRVHAATVTAGDVVLRRIPRLLWVPLRVFGMPPRKHTPGHEFAGEVEAVGQAVTRFKPGDQVFGTTTGLTVGANAEYVCLPEEWNEGVLGIKPENMTYEEAAAVPVGAMTALTILRSANVQPGQKVLVYGASGSVGTYAVQLAKDFGAAVTGVCSGRNVDLVKSLGAEQVVDYTQEDVTQRNDSFDVIFDAVGKGSRSRLKTILKETGRYVSTRGGTIHEGNDLLNALKKLIEAGKLKAVIDRRFPLEQVPEAHRYVEEGHKTGNVVITVG